MANDSYRDALPTAARKVWQLLKDGMSDNTPFKAFYYGDPVAIPESLMPCIVVDTKKSHGELGATQFDARTIQVLIKVIFNKKDDFGASPAEATTKMKVEYYTEGRDKTTGLYVPHSVQGIVRKNITLEEGVDTAAGLSDDIDYDIIFRPEESMTQEAHITLYIDQSINVPNRS